MRSRRATSAGARRAFPDCRFRVATSRLLWWCRSWSKVSTSHLTHSNSPNTMAGYGLYPWLFSLRTLLRVDPLCDVQEPVPGGLDASDVVNPACIWTACTRLSADLLSDVQVALSDRSWHRHAVAARVWEQRVHQPSNFEMPTLHCPQVRAVEQVHFRSMLDQSTNTFNAPFSSISVEHILEPAIEIHVPVIRQRAIIIIDRVCEAEMLVSKLQQLLDATELGLIRSTCVRVKPLSRAESLERGVFS